MLKKLKINNFAIIENVELQFENQLTVITGETGSGKSILLGALNLLLGERADYSLIRDNSGKTIVEGVWAIREELIPFFTENDLDFDSECIIRREILKEGKSRAFINDSPVNLNVLRSLTQQLIYIHSQHNTLELRDRNFQLSLLDVLGNHQDLLVDYQVCYANYVKIKEAHKKVAEHLNLILKERDYNNFQLEELNELKLDKINYEDLQNQLKQIENQEFIIENTTGAVQILDHPEGVLSSVNRLKQLLNKIAPHAKVISDILNRIESCEIELRDIHQELEHFIETFSMNTAEMDQLNAQLDAYQKALRKHQVTTQSELQAVHTVFSNKSNVSFELEEKLEELNLALTHARADLVDKGNTLSIEREKAAVEISEKLAPYFDRLKLKDARVSFSIKPKTDFDASGNDSIELLFSTNLGVAPQPIEKVASGGELGRLMLIFMTLLSEKKALPTVIFDEIDTGVSGEVADRIGQLLREMGRNRQLLTITHLPQVASAGHHHLNVKKVNIGANTIAQVISLTPDERRLELAKLLSGEEISDAALENAKQLLSQHD